MNGTIFIATTNHYEKLDHALIRDGRFDYTLSLTFCKREQLSDIFSSFFNDNIDPTILDRFPEDKWTTSSVISRLSKYILLYHNFNKEVKEKQEFVLKCLLL
jgi:SpoVK/Ycf46/Vps4 family AAA+-type ATPase